MNGFPRSFNYKIPLVDPADNLMLDWVTGVDDKECAHFVISSILSSGLCSSYCY